jgi:hypothetical protein
MSEQMQARDIERFLIERWAFSPARAEDATRRLIRQPAVRDAFTRWMAEPGQLPDLAYAEFSLATLVARYFMKPVGAFLTLAWLYEDPAAARAWLGTGYDRIVTPEE